MFRISKKFKVFPHPQKKNPQKIALFRMAERIERISRISKDLKGSPWETEPKENPPHKKSTV